MHQYVGYFFEDGSQIVALVAVALVWFGFAAVGAAIGGRGRLREVDHLIGWSLAGFLFTLGGVFVKAPFTLIAVTAGTVALGAAVYTWRRDSSLLAPGLGRMLMLGLPLLILVSAMKGSQWDEFTDWLVIPRYLLETDAFPSRANPFTSAVFVAYPYGWHIVGYLTGRIGGELLECAGALSNVLLLYGFALLVVRLIHMGAGRTPEGERTGWSLAAVAMLAVTLLNPTFVQKIVLTAYAETASAVATGTAAVLAWMALDALASREYDRARSLAWTLGLVLALLVNLKQATLVLVVLVVIAATLVALRDPAVPFVRFLKLTPAIIIPAVIIFLSWRYHVATELKTGEMSVRPMAEWYVNLIPQIVYKMLTILAKKGFYALVFLAIVGFGLFGFWRARTSFDRLAAVAALVMLGYTVFLLFVYVTTFGKFDALRAASFWRYNMHLGGIVVAFGAYGCAVLWRTRLAGRYKLARFAWIPIGLIVALPFVFAHKLRFDREPLIRHYRAIGAAVSELVGPKDYIYNIDPNGSGESTVALSFEIAERARLAGQVSAFDAEREAIFSRTLSRPEVNALVVHSWLPGFAEKLGVELVPGRSYFLRRKPGGGWQTVKSWPAPTVY
jgi:hypothetical protein